MTCHLGDSANHTFKAEVSACVACHADAKDTDINGKVTEMQGKYDALKAALEERTTTADNAKDRSPVDLGYHYPR